MALYAAVRTSDGRLHDVIRYDNHTPDPQSDPTDCLTHVQMRDIDLAASHRGLVFEEVTRAYVHALVRELLGLGPHENLPSSKHIEWVHWERAPWEVCCHPVIKDGPRS